MTYSIVFDQATGKPSATCIKRDSDGAVIPADPNNVDWQAYLAWRDAGQGSDGVKPADPADAPPEPGGGPAAAPAKS